MFVLYLDESGVPEKHPSQTSHYILLGAAIHEGTWFALERRINDIKSSYAIGDPRGLELHAAWLIRPYFEQDKIPEFAGLTYSARLQAVRAFRDAYVEHELPALSKSKRGSMRRYFKETENTAHLTLVERQNLYNRVLKAVASHHQGLYLFGEAIDKNALPAGVDPVEQSFTQVIARFEGFLQSRSNPRQWGLIAADRDDNKAGRFQAMLAQFQEEGTAWRNIERVIEAPFFFDSASSSGVQVTDLCAYALRRYLERTDELAPFWTIFPKFHREKGKLHGLRHYTKPKSCQCIISAERGFGKEDLEVVASPKKKA